MALYKTFEELYMVHKTSRNFTKLLERFVSMSRSLMKSAEPKKVVNKSYETFCIVPNLKCVGAKMVNLHSSVINFFTV